MDQTKTARLSADGLYRYQLARYWNPQAPPMLFIMLNPSTADADQDDATIRSCIRLAKHHGCGSIVVANLFAFRATKPADMKAASDPVGPENDAELKSLFIAAMIHGAYVVFAWGVHGALWGRDKAVEKMALDHGVAPRCFGTTKDGAPRHPLYVASVTPLEDYG